MTDKFQSFAVLLPTGQRTFSSPSEVEDFITSHDNTWEWLVRKSEWNSVREVVQRSLVTARELNAQWNDRPDLTESVLPNLRSQIENAFNSRPPKALLRDSPEGQFVFLIKGDFGDEVATAVALSFCSQSTPFNMSTGAALAAIFRMGWDAENRGTAFNSVHQACVAKLDELKQQHSDEFDAHSAQSRKDTEESTALRQSHENAASRQRSDFEKKETERFDHASGEWTRFVRRAEDELARLEKALQESLTLKAPAAYWEQKRLGHGRAALWWGLGTVGIGASMLGWIWYLVNEYFDNPPPGEADWRYFVIKRLPIVLLGALGFWMLRIGVRVFLSHLHLRADAKERTVLAETYLALKAQNSDMTAADREIVLKQLLRHTPSGLNKDDAAPQISIEKLK